MQAEKQVEKTVIKDAKKVETEIVKEGEKTIEMDEKIEAFSRLKDNLNPYFWKGKNKYSEVREKVLSKVEKFKKRNNIKNEPVEVKYYIKEFKNLLESHGKDTKNIKTLEDIKNYLTINH